MNEALLAITASLIAVMTWMIKAMNARSEKLMEQREREVLRALDALEESVNLFRRTEQEEWRIHSRMMDAMDALASTQNEIMSQLSTANHIQSDIVTMIRKIST